MQANWSGLGELVGWKFLMFAVEPMDGLLLFELELRQVPMVPNLSNHIKVLS